MANRTDRTDGSNDSRETTPEAGTGDRVEQVSGTADDETDGFDESDDEEMDEDEEEVDEGTA